MAEVFRARIFDTEREIAITDPEAIASAAKFKDLSDAVWAQKPKETRLAAHSIPSSITPIEVRTQLNEVLREIDEKFVVSGVSKALSLGQVHGQGELVIIDAATMDNPTSAGVETFNWDNRNGHRIIQLNGENTAVEFLDGHTDYYRELGIKLGLGRGAVATYSMQRMQSYQDQTTGLHLSVWHTHFAEMGYEGHQIAYADITEQQEDRMLTLAQTMTGLSKL